MNRLFVDVHVLQTVPPSNLNRDDAGSPKSAVYGGVRRARVSSQAWKKATRAEFADRLPAEDIARRTKRVVELMVTRMRAQDPDMTHEQATAAAAAVLKLIGIDVVPPRVKPAKTTKGTKGTKGIQGTNGKESKTTTETTTAETATVVGATQAGVEAEEHDTYDTTKYLLFLSNRQIDRLADLAVQGGAKKADAVRAADTDHGIEVSLFGRMVADAKEISVDAAVQVAHALSTHGVQEESDYYTAVDDETPQDQTGAGMIGTVEFNSATLYRYATIDVTGLHTNLYGDQYGEHTDATVEADATVRAVQEFVRAFALSMPTGKQNTFANRTVPDAVVVILRQDRPVSLVGAFEDAVVADGTSGLVRASAERLAAQTQAVAQFVDAPLAVLVTHADGRTSALDALGDTMPLADLVTRLEAPVREAIGAHS